MEEFCTYTLPNGIRGIHRRERSSVTHCALIIGAGSRDELQSQFGLAHFAEHAFFKGTHKRKAYQVNCRLENMGGELNAFTTKEDTTIHATTLRGDFRKAVELISDVTFNSTFPDAELDKEREVICDEINTYKDSPVDMIYDTFEDMIFADSELGHNILGRKKSISRYDGDSIRNFIRRTHTTDNMVFSSIGNLSPKAVEAVAMHYFGDIAPTNRSYERVVPPAIIPFDKSLTKHTHQTHCIIGARAYGIRDPKRLPLALLVNILGGPCANSRLNVVVREKHGLSYNIEATYTPYSDSGAVAIYFSSDHCNAERCEELIAAEIDSLRENLLTPRRLSMAKKQFTAQLAIAMESNEGYMLGNGKSLLLHGAVDTMSEAYKKIEAVTAMDIADVANEVLTNRSRLIYR